MRLFLGLAATLGLVAGCGHMETHQAMLRAPEPATNKADLYMADQPLPARPYYEIAMIQAIGFGDEAHPEDVAAALTAKASKLGCDAVLRTYIAQGYSRTHANGVCVKWLGPAPPAPEPNIPPHRPLPTPPNRSPAPGAPRIEPLPSSGVSGGGS